jgi:transcriptional regulator GlxA family with amidase domain
MQKEPLHFCFLLFDGFSNMVLASALEPLRVAQQLPNSAELTWDILTLDGSAALSSSGIEIAAQGSLLSMTKSDYLVVVSGYGIREHTTKEACSELRRAARRAGKVVGADTGSWLMAASGILDGTAATIHWQEMAAFEETFHRITVSQRRYVVEAATITCGGASTVMELILHLLGEHFGPSVAFDVSNMFIFDVERQHHLGRGPDRLKAAGSPKLKAAVDLMIRHVEFPMSLPEIADSIPVSMRSLNRIFARELGLTPGKYYQLIRLGRARELARETDFALAEIALRTGFSSASTLSRAFSSTYSMSFNEVRARREKD